MRTIFNNANVITPFRKFAGSVSVASNQIEEAASTGEIVPSPGDTVIDAKGCPLQNLYEVYFCCCKISKTCFSFIADPSTVQPNAVVWGRSLVENADSNPVGGHRFLSLVNVACW